MRTSWIELLVLLLLTLNQSCCNDGEIQPDGARLETLATGHLKDFEPYRVAYGKLRSTVEYDMDCYERKENAIPLRYHEDLDTAVVTIRTVLPVEFVVLRISKEDCANEKMCMKIMRAMRRDSLRVGCRPLDNFYVGGDGYVYEGRGWDAASFWNLNGLRRMAITVNFLVNYTKGPPPSRVIEAFRSFLDAGVWLGKISKNYKITSMREIHKNDAYSGVKFQKSLMTWERWVNITALSSMWQYVTPKRLTIVSRNQWNALEPIKELVPITSAVGNIMISDGSGEQCLNGSQCNSWLKSEQMEERPLYGDVIHNFYIGPEGEVYEGRGWDVAPLWELPRIKNGLLSVRMIGSFETKPPSEPAINSLKLLVHVGERLGKISPKYRMFSLRQLYNDTRLTGESLYRIAERWAPWWRDEDSLITGNKPGIKEIDILPIFPMVGQREWDAEFRPWSSGRWQSHVDHVIVYYGGDRCFTRRECTASLKREEGHILDKYGSLLDNFYIGEDGIIYEGLRMNELPKWSSVFPNMSFITVKFLGHFGEEAPAWPAMAAFKALLKTGTESGHLSKNHTLTTLRLTYSEGPPLTKGLEGALKEIKSWSGKMTTGTTIFPRNVTVPVGQWAGSSRPRFPKLRTPMKYVVVGIIQRRCSTKDSCIAMMREQYFKNADDLKDILYNFYIGEDGWVYEGRGWEGASKLNVKEMDGDFLFVVLHTRFRDRLPSPIEMYGFRSLLEQGVRTGKLAPDYKIVSIGKIFPDLYALPESIETWEKGDHHWSEVVPYSSGEDNSPSGCSIYVSRENWSAVSWLAAEMIRMKFHPPGSRYLVNIQSVLVRNVGGRCLTPEECTDFVRAEMNKSVIHTERFSMENFYLGGDGHVYEGWGWRSPPDWHWTGRTNDVITVAFIGDFKEDPPNPRAMFAFEYLVKFGMFRELIGRSYRVILPGSHCTTESIVGEALAKQIMTLENWSSSFIDPCPNVE